MSRWTSRTLQVRKEKTPKCVLEPPLVSWCRPENSGDNLQHGHEAVGVRLQHTAEALRSFATREKVLLCTPANGSSVSMDVENAPSEKSPKCILAPPVVSWRTRKAGNDILPMPLGGGYSSLFFRRCTTLLSGRVLVHAER
ncbi:hypothetical protein TNIN_126381 [Trichonephila inaurata madagascariensis]|uniref:Uncharacterized protein n=1 Tax=Trichonephila inaurata madagascariensis TaxID=2747483 RepID=A0A8X7CQ65_9ARAC|nr:hypothetical protein TNIN_126381 [Trichonephila inaurata madagascariensis]